MTYPNQLGGIQALTEYTGKATTIQVTGSNKLDVPPVVTGGGSIKVENNGAHVAATQTGTGSLNVVNNGDVLAATNTGSGSMIVNSDATGAVAVTRVGIGNTFVTATGSAPIVCTIRGDGNATYPTHNLRASLEEQNVIVTGLHSKDMSPTVNGGNGNTFVTATGSTPIACTVTGEGDVVYLNQLDLQCSAYIVNANGDTECVPDWTDNKNIQVTGINKLDTAPVLKGEGKSIHLCREQRRSCRCHSDWIWCES